MSPRKRGRIATAVWLAMVVAAVSVIANARFTADLSAFLPTRPTPEQALLIDQLREGPASHLILVAIDGDGDGATVTDPLLARLSRETAARLRTDERFLSVSNGENVTAGRDRDLLFNHRYLLSDRTGPARFERDGLHAALGESLDLLASSAGLMLQPLLARDPTAELVHLVETLTAGRDLPTVDGAWIARSPEQGPHALLVVETRTSGSDIDGQQSAIGALRSAFDGARGTAGATASGVRLVLSGPPVFAVDARDTIEREATRLSIAGATLVALLLGFVYRSLRALVLGLLPMITGALCGLAAVAAGFGVVHGIALGFGVTLIGEAVDYAIYLFMQRSHGSGESGRHGFWATIALGVATSVIGFGALLFSGFQGLAQIGLLSIVGLVAAAFVTRWVLPAWIPHDFAVRPMPTVGRALVRAAATAPRLRWAVVAIALAAVVVLVVHRDALWSRDLASLSPIPASLQETDARLRAELGAPDVRDVVVVRAADGEAALHASERVTDALAPLVADGTLAGIESPSRYLPSAATQRARQHALPDDATLRAAFGSALDGLPFVKSGFDGFFDDVARERNGSLVTRADLDRTSLGPALRALLGGHGTDGGWTAVVALRSPLGQSEARASVARMRVAAALTDVRARVDGAADRRVDHPVEIRAIDIKAETQDLYASYLSEALRMAGIGALSIVALLAAALRDAARLARVLVPLVVAVLVVAAAHVVAAPLTLFHFVGLLLIVAVGSNYALFFDRRSGLESSTGDPADDRALLVSLVVANATAVIGFGVLGLSSLPVLHAIGSTVAPGALLALVGAAVFAARGDAATMRRP